MSCARTVRPRTESDSRNRPFPQERRRLPYTQATLYEVEPALSRLPITNLFSAYMFVTEDCDGHVQPDTACDAEPLMIAYTSTCTLSS